MCGHRSEHCVAGTSQELIVRDIARTDQLDASCIEAALIELLDERVRLGGGYKGKDCLGCRIARPLQERREVWVLQGYADVLGDRASRCEITALESRLGFLAGGEVADQCDDL